MAEAERRSRSVKDISLAQARRDHPSVHRGTVAVPAALRRFGALGKMKEPRTKRQRGRSRLQRGAPLALGLGLAVQCAACAPTNLAYNPGHVPAQQMGQIENVCAMVARLPSGSSQDYDVCQESLSRSLASRLKAERLLASRRDCLARGASPGTTALSTCELEVQTSRSTPSAQKVSSEPAPRPLVVLPRLDLRHREQRACAEIGFDPVDRGFSQCVADLDAELSAVHRPIM